MHKELFEIAIKYGDDCSKCKEVCCANMALDISRDELKRMAKTLKINHVDFRKKYTVLFKSMFKHMELKTMSKEAKIQLDRNPRLLKFDEIDPKEINLPEEQLKRLVEWSKDNKDIKILICPFYEKDTHKCKVHKTRPMACYLYPFNYGIGNKVDLRKLNACALSTNCLKRFSKFCILEPKVFKIWNQRFIMS